MPASLAVAGVLLFGSAVAGWFGRLPPNGFVGIRTRTTQATREGWYAAHRVSAAAFGTAGLVLICASLVSPSFVEREVAVATSLATSIVLVCVGGVQGQLAARRAIRNRQDWVEEAIRRPPRIAP